MPCTWTWTHLTAVLCLLLIEPSRLLKEEGRQRVIKSWVVNGYYFTLHLVLIEMPSSSLVIIYNGFFNQLILSKINTFPKRQGKASFSMKKWNVNSARKEGVSQNPTSDFLPVKFFVSLFFKLFQVGYIVMLEIE